jgi:hypothetical protein
MFAVLKEFYITLFRALIPGRMNLGVAWLFAFFAVPLSLGGLAELFAGSAADQFIFFGLIGSSALGTPVVAWWKGRRWWTWSLGSVGTAGIMIGIVIPVVQPITVIVALLLAEPARGSNEEEGDEEPGGTSALRVPEGASEPAGLRDLRDQHDEPQLPAAPPRPARSRRRPRH